MAYLVKLADGAWIHRGKPVKRIDHATIFNHPSDAVVVLARNEGAKLIPFADVKNEWHAALCEK
jgi:hypothetical protein